MSKTTLNVSPQYDALREARNRASAVLFVPTGSIVIRKSVSKPTTLKAASGSSAAARGYKK